MAEQGITKGGFAGGIIAASVLGAGSPPGLNVTFAAQPVYPHPMSQASVSTSVDQQTLDLRLKIVGAETDAKFATVNGKIDVLSSGFKALELRFGEFSAKFVTVPQDLATLTERVSHLPSKGWFLTRAGTMTGLIITAITLQDKLRTFLHIG